MHTIKSPRAVRPSVGAALCRLAAPLAAFLLGLSATPSAQAATIAAWDFSTISSTSNWGASPMAPTTKDANVTVVGLTRGWTYGSSGTPAAAAWGGNNFSNSATTEAAAITASNFATCSFTVATGYKLSLSDIAAYNIRRSSTGPTTGRWQYKIGSGTFSDIGTSDITWGSTTTSAGNAKPAITLSSIPALQDVPAGTTVTFRVITWGASSTGGTWYLNDPSKTTAADLTINGTVSPATPVSTYTLTYNGNGHTGGTAPTDTTSYASGATVTVQGAGTLTKANSSFNGWNTASTGTGTSRTAGSTFAINANTTLYAQWVATPSATITLGGTLAAVDTTYGTASAPTGFTVAGTALTSNLTVTAPAGFEVALSSGGTFNTSTTITASGTLSATPVHVRLAANAAAGIHSGDITVSGGGALTRTIATVASTVAKKSLTVTGASVTSKPYDGTNTATITGASLVGVLSGDTVTVSGGGTFADFNAANGIQVTGALVLGGTHGGNYSLIQPTLTGAITQAGQTITFAALPAKSTTDADFALTGTASSNLPLTYTSSNSTVATVSGSTVHIVGVGTTTFTATQEGDNNHTAATPVSQTLTVSTGSVRTVIMSEDFATLTAGGNTANTGTGSPSGTEITANLTANFPTSSKTYSAGGAVKLGTSSLPGSMTSRSLDLGANGGSFKVSFDVKGWTSVESSIVVTVGSQSQTVSYSALLSSPFETHTLTFTGGQANSTITFATTAKRAFIDNVVVYFEGTPVTYHVAYDGNTNTGGTAPTDSTAYSAGASVHVLGAGTLTKTGNAFIGWNTAANGTGTSRSVGSTFTINADTTLFAQWTDQRTNPTVFAAATPGAVGLGKSAVITATVTPGQNPVSTELVATADLSSIGGSAAQALYDDGTHGDNVASDNVFSLQFTVPAGTTKGAKSIPVSVIDTQARQASTTLAFGVVDGITILHMNDVHARLTPHKWIVPTHTTNTTPVFEDVGGAAFLAGKILERVNALPQALVLDAGDMSEGNPIGDMNGNGSMTGFYELLSNKLKTISGRNGRGMDAVVVGNHDVRDTTYVSNLQALAASGVPVLSVNVCSAGTQTPYFAASTTVTVGGVKVGILGYTTQTAEVGASLASSLTVIDCDWKSSDSTKIHLADKVKDLRDNQGCAIVILLAHIGQTAIATSTTDRDGDEVSALLADDGTTKLPEVAVTGHWHSYADTVWQPEMLDYKTIFTESGSYMNYLGELTIDGAGKYLDSKQHVIRNADITPDADVVDYVNNLKAAYDAAHTIKADQVVGYTANDLLLDNRMRWWSASEYPWSGNNTAGQWICDAIRWKAAQIWGSCDLSIETGGGVRSDIAQGPVTMLQVYEVFPWSDDWFVRVNMTGQEIVNFLKITNCNSGFSKELVVTAFDGVPSDVRFNGTPIDLAHSYTVCINNYMFDHPPKGWVWSTAAKASKVENTTLCRDGIVEFMQTVHGTPGTAYTTGGNRYILNTEFSGGYRVVVTLMSDDQERSVFETAFIRFLDATPETLAHRGTPQVPVDLVNADGSINPANRLSEGEFYRSYLGFREGQLKHGDILEVWGKNSFYGGNPEFVEQEGIVSDGVEFKVVGHDESLARPKFMPSILEFWNDDYKNHYVQFLARKAGTDSITDQFSQTIKAWDDSGYAAYTLPGNTGDLLLVSGVLTMEKYAFRFRVAQAVQASTAGYTGFPASSAVNTSIDPVAPFSTASSLTLTATAGAANRVWNLSATADAQIVSGYPTNNYGASTNIYVQTSAATYGNERGLFKFDLSALPAGSEITAAQLQLYCFSASSSYSLPTELLSVGDSWTESTVNWNNQPALGSVIGTQSLVQGTQNVWYNWDVTSTVRSELAGDKVTSFLLKPVTESSSTAVYYKFDAKEYGSGTPTLQVTTAAGAAAEVAQVQFYYRYSANNSTWGSWTLAGTDTTAPYSTTFNYPAGEGYYEFYSVGTASGGTVEPAPLAADTLTRYYVSTRPYTTEAIISFSGFEHTYDGTAKPVSITTIPAGLATTVTYNGSATIPVHAGTYAVTATVTESGYTGSANGTLVIAPAAASVALGNLDRIFNGAAQGVTVTTVPAGLAYSVTYDGAAIIPVHVGTYAVAATVTDGDYTGSATGTFQIVRATQTISFAPLGSVPEGAAAFALPATASSGLPVSFSSSNPEIASVNGNMVTVHRIGSTTITATQTGNGDYYAAADAAQLLTVSAALTPEGGDIPLLPPWAFAALAVLLVFVAMRSLPRVRMQ